MSLRKITGAARFLSVIAIGIAMGLEAVSAGSFSCELVSVGNPGNAPSLYSYGAVDWEYQIGKYEVTIHQYTDFLNAVASSDPYALYNPKMGTDLNSAGIQRSGPEGAYIYSVMDNGGSSAQRPITYVSWFDAARFANWMSNGQPAGPEAAGTTEDGAYTLPNGITSGVAPSKNAVNPHTGSAPEFYLPSEDEWYKAAFYSPEQNDGTGGYWRYATQSDAVPGNIIGPEGNQVNYIVQPSGFFSVTQNNVLSPGQNYLTDVGAFTDDASYYGTYDQNGNVWELLDTAYGTTRALLTVRGGGWTSYENYLWDSYRLSSPTSGESSNGGFRLAAPASLSVVFAVPEPSAGILILAGVAAWLVLGRWRRGHLASVLLTGSGLTNLQAVSYPLVTVGDPGNPVNEATGLGSVPVEFQIGIYDVTLAQYAEFLNAVAESDPYGLYNVNMGTNLNIAGILRSGVPGSYTYSVMDNGGPSGNRPITYVSWFDAARFANWMANGQLSGTPEAAASLEDGAYTLNGVIDGVAPARNAVNPLTGSAPSFYIPSEDEWYKAAYYSPSKNGGSGGYYQYAMQADAVLGNAMFSAEGQANVYMGAFATTQSNIFSNAENYLTDVGAYVESGSFYGTFDQNGNVYQWNDLAGAAGASRGVAGGFWFGGPSSASNTTLASQTASYEGNDTGFRLAAPIPEPGIGVLCGTGLAVVALRRKSRRTKQLTEPALLARRTGW